MKDIKQIAADCEMGEQETALLDYVLNHPDEWPETGGVIGALYRRIVKLEGVLTEKEEIALRIGKLLHGDKAAQRYPLIDLERFVAELMREAKEATKVRLELERNLAQAGGLC